MVDNPTEVVVVALVAVLLQLTLRKYSKRKILKQIEQKKNFTTAHNHSVVVASAEVSVVPLLKQMLDHNLSDLAVELFQIWLLTWM